MRDDRRMRAWVFGLLSMAVILAGPVVPAGSQLQPARPRIQPPDLEPGPAGQPAEPAARPRVYVGEVDAIIQPVSAEYMIKTIDEADAAEAALLVFILRTPGGLVDSTREIISRIIRARTPVAIFVSPGGARAASAGFYIIVSADIGAMSPGTHIGAAHPVAGTGEQTNETMSQKAASDLAAYVRSLAGKRNRNVALAEEAVLKSRSFTEREALDATPPLIDLIATDLDDLLEQLHGRTVMRFDGSSTELRTQDAEVTRIEMTWRQRLLSAVAHPQVAYLLFTLGTLGLTIELWNPGAIVPGVVGGLCLLLAFFAFQILPISYAGVALVLFGLFLLLLEIKVASFGLLALGGFISLMFGSLMLIDSPLPELQIGLRVIVPAMLALGGLFLFLARLAFVSQMRRSVTGPTGMLEEAGRALVDFAPRERGRVQVRGEIWNAVSDEPLAAGDDVRVTGVEGLVLTVKRANSTSKGAGHD
jgi:membrane-bound serine protease (ClpP class)